jgi:protoheme IX farnesyltransferase
MTLISTSAGEFVAVHDSAAARRGIVGLYMQLTKARLSALVLVTTAVGFVLADPAPIDWLRLMWTMIGTALAAGCASALNQIIEAHLDRRMHRTRQRPIPSGSMSVIHGFVTAMLMGFFGLSILALGANLAAAWMALTTILIYVLLYTPLKMKSTVNTMVGAVCGAIPPMIGWVAATGSLSPRAWILAAILFVWQIPHFFALAWLYRDDYARAGFIMLPVVDVQGHITCRVIVLTSLLMVPLALMATLVHLAGYVYALGSIALGIWMAALSVLMYVNPTDRNARRMFIASITYLPLLMCLMVLDRI